MRIECNVDGKALSLTVNSIKPLSLILMESYDVPSLKTHCGGKHCGKCLVIFNDQVVLSCLIPAFRAKDAIITTFDGFVRSRDYRDIEKAYASTGFTPCQNCFGAQTLLIESILRRYENNDFAIDTEEILQESTLIKCHCVDSTGFLETVNAALVNRRKRHVRRT